MLSHRPAIAEAGRWRYPYYSRHSGAAAAHPAGARPGGRRGSAGRRWRHCPAGAAAGGRLAGSGRHRPDRTVRDDDREDRVHCPDAISSSAGVSVGIDRIGHVTRVTSGPRWTPWRRGGLRSALRRRSESGPRWRPVCRPPRQDGGWGQRCPRRPGVPSRPVAVGGGSVDEPCRGRAGILNPWGHAAANHCWVPVDRI